MKEKTMQVFSLQVWRKIHHWLMEWVQSHLDPTLMPSSLSSVVLSLASTGAGKNLLSLWVWFQSSCSVSGSAWNSKKVWRMKTKSSTTRQIFFVVIQLPTIRRSNHLVTKKCSYKNTANTSSPFARRTRSTMSKLVLHLDFRSAWSTLFLQLFSTLVASLLNTTSMNKRKCTIWTQKKCSLLSSPSSSAPPKLVQPCQWDPILVRHK